MQQTDDRFGRSCQLFLSPFISKRVNSHQESIWLDSIQSCGVYSVEHNFLGIAWIVLRLVSNESSHSSGSKTLWVLWNTCTADGWSVRSKLQLFLTPQEAVLVLQLIVNSSPHQELRHKTAGLFPDWIFYSIIMRRYTGVGPHLPRGVSWHKKNKSYRAQVFHDGRIVTIGYHWRQKYRSTPNQQLPNSVIAATPKFAGSATVDRSNHPKTWFGLQWCLQNSLAGEAERYLRRGDTVWFLYRKRHTKKVILLAKSYEEIK